MQKQKMLFVIFKSEANEEHRQKTITILQSQFPDANIEPQSIGIALHLPDDTDSIEAYKFTLRLNKDELHIRSTNVMEVSAQ